MVISSTKKELESNLKLKKMNYSQLRFEIQSSIMWGYMTSNPRPCFTPTLVKEINHWFAEIADQSTSNTDFVVISSDIKGVFSLGGDLHFFKTLIDNQDRSTLLRYTEACVNMVHSRMTGLGRGITNISLVEGDALGGGFEFALSSDVLVAERGTKLGFPEVSLNLFPGVGAYSILVRRLGSVLADHLITSGKIYTAEELYEMRLIDILADPGKGKQAIFDYIRKVNRSPNTFKTLHKVKQICSPISKDELMEVAKIWANAVFQLENKDLRRLSKIIYKQEKKILQ